MPNYPIRNGKVSNNTCPSIQGCPNKVDGIPIEGGENPFLDEDTFICHRRYLHRLTKTPSSPYEGIFIKTEVQNGIIRLLSPYRKTICESLSQGNYAEAVTVLLEVLESLTYHFVEDEHYDYFDDMYSPDYVCQDMMEAVINSIKNGNFSDERLQQLKNGLEKLKHTEAYEDYGAPFALDMWEKFLA